MNAPDPLAAALPALQKRHDNAAERVKALEAKLSEARDELLHARSAMDHIRSLMGDPSENQSNASSAEGATVAIAQGAGKSSGFAKLMMNDWNSILAETIATLNASPEGMDAVALALKEAPRPLTLEELTEAVHALGWYPDTQEQERAVRAAGNRLRQRDPDFHYQNKLWLYLPRHTPQLPQRLNGAAELTDERDAS